MSDIEGEIHSLCVGFSLPGHHDDDVSPFDRRAYCVLSFFILYDLRSKKMQEEIEKIDISLVNTSKVFGSVVEILHHCWPSDSNSDPPHVLLFRTVCDTVALFLFVSEMVGAYFRHRG